MKPTRGDTARTSTRAPGKKTLILILVLAGLGCVASMAVYLFNDSESMKKPALGVFAGWLGAGLMGLSGWWTSRKALTGGRNDMLKYMVGGMLARMLACGLGSGLVVGLDLLDRNGFVFGLLTGLAVFLAVEIGGIYISSSHQVGRISPRGD